MKYLLTLIAVVFVASAVSAQTSIENSGTRLPQAEGEGWYKQQSGTTARLDRVYFFNRDSGWAYANGVQYKTTNGGTTWEFIPIPSTYSIQYFLNFDTAIASSGRYIKYTTDAGVSWSDTIYVDVGRQAIGPLHAFTLDSIFTFAESDEWSYTTNRGKTWVNVRQHVPGVDQTERLLFENSTVGYVTGGLASCIPPPFPVSSGIAKTTDGGKSWNAICTENKIKSPVEDLYGMWAKGDFIVLVGDYNFIAVSHNGGINWDTISTWPRYEVYFGVNFPTSSTGYICGSSGIILKTTDSGFTWQKQRSTIEQGIDTGISIFLYDVVFVDSLNGWAAGEGGTILRTMNGGQTWVRQSPPLIDILQSAVVIIAPCRYELRYRLPESERVTIELYNVSGVLVRTLIHDDMQAQGDYKIQIPTGGLASGTYFYRIRTDNYQVSGSCIICPSYGAMW